ncbi:hypothetical protein C9I87_10345 [Photobacterium iliopiscarium]|uniref:hypothetical protein n=1 Tax=Photobacterium iliopiscarium TaxID=56192 RepID=UPI000D16B749|nr:hypothetical protein [Photobacterium iliopiscarium]PST95342.1 hypothetical protein C9I87_10345 [Photobacterium iliopiscarium]
MNKHQQSGMTTLLITSMLLIVALLFSLASYKNLFYQIKRTQNEVLARQAHWAAEGGLECGFAEISNKSDVNTSLDKCKTVIDGQPLTFRIDTGDGKSVLTSEINKEYKNIGYKKIAKTIVAGGVKSSGVIKSSADLYFKGDYGFFPDPNNKYSANVWECIVLRYKNNIYIHGKDNSGIGNKGFEFIKPPYKNFFTWPGDIHQCVTNHKTELNTKNTRLFKSDMVHEPLMDIFKETFGVSRDEWTSVRGNGIFHSIEVEKNDDCALKIKNVINKNRRHIWVDGDCILDNVDNLNLLSIEIDKLKGVFILVHNGILGLHGTSKLKMALYHFNSTYYPNNPWEGTSFSGMVLDLEMYKYIGFDPVLDLKKIERLMNNVVFYMYGANVPDGGFIFDTPNQVTYFNGSKDMSFNGELINDLLAPFGKPRWKKGSWHDF